MNANTYEYSYEHRIYEHLPIHTNPSQVLVALLEEPAACGKTFEMFTLAGYPAPRALGPVLEKLAPDSQPLSEAAVEAT